jgi:signal transduction histidine kinase
LLGWLNGTLNALDEGILLITSDHRVPLVNRRALELLGLPEKIARGVHHFEQIRDIQYANGEFFDPATGTQPPRWPLTDLGRAMAFERTRPNGTVLAISQLPLADGGAVRVIRDVTQQRKAEAELRQAQKLEALGHLTAGIAHDFNNILSVITLNLEVLENPGDLLPAEIAALLEDAIGAAQTATDLIDGLLKFSRQQALKLTPTDIAKLLTACLPLLRQALASKLVLAIDVQADLWSAEIDAAQLQSALLNLAINARDASPSGSELRITAANVSFLEEAGSPPPSDIAPGDYVLVTVADQGQGMDPAVLARVFEPFFTTKGVGVGNGLGLSMVFGTIRQMEGTVTIDSTPGAGTSVHLYLPRAAKLVSVTGS